VIFWSWNHDTVFDGWSNRLFYSVFHAISAFNNAGFSLYTDGLHQSAVRFQYLIHLEIAFLIVVGGMGFLVLQDIFAVESRRDRKRHPWKKLQVNTRLVMLMTVLLIGTGTLLFYVFEYNHSLSEHSGPGKLVSAFFQSVTTRTAGFNTVNITNLGRPALLLVLVLMFIGASPGSTGGGVKTTTIAVAVKAALANIRGREHVEFFKRNISWTYVNKTIAVLIFALAFIVLFTFFLVLAEPDLPLSHLFFELISAFGTVGLSMGITSDLSVVGKLILIISMFVGRIGFLTLGLALTRKVLYTKYKYPTGRLMIG
jgi:Trk-type K+ transport system membrane component